MFKEILYLKSLSRTYKKTQTVVRWEPKSLIKLRSPSALLKTNKALKKQAMHTQPIMC